MTHFDFLDQTCHFIVWDKSQVCSAWARASIVPLFFRPPIFTSWPDVIVPTYILKAISLVHYNFLPSINAHRYHISARYCKTNNWQSIYWLSLFSIVTKFRKEFLNFIFKKIKFQNSAQKPSERLLAQLKISHFIRPLLPR